MSKDRPPSFQWYPRDFAAEMHQLGVSDEVELAYRRALDASWDSGHYGVGTVAQWFEWGRVKADLELAFSQALASLTQPQADGTYAQLRMVRDRMEQAIRHKASVKGGSKGGRKSRGSKRKRDRVSPHQGDLKPNQPLASASASASALESKTESKEEALPHARSRRLKAGPNRTLTEADIARAAELTGVSLATASHLAERIRLEGPQRGYLNYPSALLNWCRRETETNGQAVDDVDDWAETNRRLERARKGLPLEKA